MLDVEDMRDGVEHREIAWIPTSTMPMDALTKHLSGCPPLDRWLSGQNCHFYDRAQEAKFVGIVKVEECEEICKRNPEHGIHVTLFRPDFIPTMRTCVLHMS